MDIFTTLLLSKVTDTSKPFKFTINTENYQAGNKTFFLGFSYYGDFANPIEVNWGDGEKEVFVNGNYFGHNYDLAGIYQISIKGINGNEMPKWNMSNLNSSSYAYSTRQIISIDSPFLSMKSYDYPHSVCSSAFYNCFNIVSICEKLFINNPQITDLSYAFGNRSQSPGNLLNIPNDLHDYTPLVTKADSEFDYQVNLKSCPDDLLQKLPELYQCDYIFRHCENMVNLPNLKTNFKLAKAYYAFSHCYKAVLKADMFGTDYQNRFSQATSPMSISFMLYRNSYSGAKIGSAPRLDLFNYPVSVSKTRALDCVALSIDNFNEISSEWK